MMPVSTTTTSHHAMRHVPPTSHCSTLPRCEFASELAELLGEIHCALEQFLYADLFLAGSMEYERRTGT